ncbi:MAG: amidohydrolase family protein [Chitinophagaceae bacterium]
MKLLIYLFVLLVIFSGNTAPKKFHTIIRNGIIYDGSGGKPYKADIGITADTIAFIGNLSRASANHVIDAKGKAVAPGFINMLSWATESLIQDGRSMGDIRQGVTLEVFGEGWSMGPLNAQMKEREEKDQTLIKYQITWNTLGEYLQMLEKKGISCNVASFVGATTIRIYVIGEDNRDPTPAELDHMKQLVAQAMEEGALGVGSSLIYPPAFFAKTGELIELCKVASKYGGMYISHMRNEGNQLMEALEELITISKQANIPAEVYHLKAAGKNNWNKIDSVVRRIENARKNGLKITADMYTYTAGATGLTSVFPPTLQDGGFGKLWERLQQDAVRSEMKKQMHVDATDWENLYYGADGGKNILLLGFRRDSLRKYIGKTLAEVAQIRNSTEEETAINLIVEDSSRVDVAYFLMSEANVKKQMKLPWVSFGSDAWSAAPEAVFLKTNVHPRSNGNFARVIGKYTRDEKVLTLPEAIRKLTKLPATNLKLKKRGQLKHGYYADVVIFDPKTVKDHATFEKPHQLATGVTDVLVNGIQVLKNGRHTGATPGKFLKGPGWKRK